MASTYRIWCVVAGRLGTRRAWLKKDRAIIEYATRAEAEAQAIALHAGMNTEHAKASFKYLVIEHFPQES